MENIFSTNPLQTIEKEMNIDENQNENAQVKDLNLYFECQHVANWINSNGYERVALQFPDELLTYSPSIALSLGDKCTNSVVFILGDTSYGR
jgi:diphthamide synthase subunit DPH2